jgi:hypothetical protein
VNWDVGLHLLMLSHYFIYTPTNFVLFFYITFNKDDDNANICDYDGKIYNSWIHTVLVEVMHKNV